jgi:hypothetical protein
VRLEFCVEELSCEPAETGSACSTFLQDVPSILDEWIAIGIEVSDGVT